MPRLTVLVTASLHVLPQRFHLGAESGSTFGSQLALGSVSQQEESLLLLANNLLGIPTAPTSAVVIRTGILLVQSSNIPTGKRIDLLHSIAPIVIHAVVIVVDIAAHDTSHGVVSVINGIHATTAVVSSLISKELLELLRIILLFEIVRLVRFQVLGNALQSISECALIHVLFLCQCRAIKMLF